MSVIKGACIAHKEMYMTVFGSKLATARTININKQKQVVVPSTLSIVLALREEGRKQLFAELQAELMSVSFGTIPEHTVRHYFNTYMGNTRIMTKKQALAAAVRGYTKTIDTSVVR